MTREDEIQKQLRLIKANPDCIGHYAAISCGVNYFKTGFEVGARWSDEHPKSPWISVKERMPEEKEETFHHFKRNVSSRVLIMDSINNVYFDSTRNGKWVFEPFDYENGCKPTEITHWMPIPPLNEEE